MKDFKFFQKKELDWYNPNENYRVLTVTPIMYNPMTFRVQRCIIYQNRRTEEIHKGEVIFEGHPFWNYSNETI